MKKKAIIILAVACMGMGLLACGKEHIDKESEINVYKEDYTPEKKHRVSGSSGMISCALSPAFTLYS